MATESGFDSNTMGMASSIGTTVTGTWVASTIITPTPTPTPDWYGYGGSGYYGIGEMEDSLSPVHLAAASLVLLIIFPSLIFIFLSVWNGRNNVEWARQSYAYYRAAFIMFIIACLFNVAVHAVVIIANANSPDLEGYFSAPSNYNVLEHFYNYAHVVARLFDCIAEMLLLVCLYQLAMGIIKAQSGVFRFNRLVNWGLVIAVVVLSLCALFHVSAIVYAQANSDYNAFENKCAGDACNWYDYSRWPSYDHSTLAQDAFKVNLGFVIIIWLLSLLITIWAAMITYGNNREARVRRTSRYLLGCSALWMLRTTFTMGVEASDNHKWSWQYGFSTVPDKKVLLIVNIVMTIWTEFVIFVLLYVLGRSSYNGLWVVDPAGITSKSIQFNQTVNNFQDIEIPKHLDHERTETASRSGDVSPVSTQAHLPTSPPPPFPASLYSEPVRSSTLPREPPVALVSRPQHTAQQPSQDWVRPPSGIPPMSISRASSPPTHEELMGFNHQADGYIPSAPLPYPEKS